jgi:hypothetical protein
MNCRCCGRPYEPRRCIGWSNLYCQPICQKRQEELDADNFAAWWNRRERKDGTHQPTNP